MDLRISASYDTSALYAAKNVSERSGADSAAASVSTNSEKPAAVYEKDNSTSFKATYNINKMSKEDRDSVVSQLKADQERRQSQLTDIVSSLMTGQANTLSKTDNMWSFLAKGDFTVTPEVKAQAIEDISEDGYWGVTQTSQRLFDFASALAGDDEDLMRQMESAMEKGFKEALGEWGRDLPQLSQDTMDASRNLFNDYYASKSKEVDVSVSI